jgi:hypothetical protein
VELTEYGNRWTNGYSFQVNNAVPGPGFRHIEWQGDDVYPHDEFRNLLTVGVGGMPSFVPYFGTPDNYAPLNVTSVAIADPAIASVEYWRDTTDGLPVYEINTFKPGLTEIIVKTPDGEYRIPLKVEIYDGYFFTKPIFDEASVTTFFDVTDQQDTFYFVAQPGTRIENLMIDPNFAGNFQSTPNFATAQPFAPVQTIMTAEDYYKKGLEMLEAGNATEGINNLEIAANNGSANAQLMLGNCYLNGNGVLPDYQKAVAWLEKACEQNNATAQYLLGSLYLNGNGVQQDAQKAAQLYGQAANQGDALAQLNLANCYVNGTGVPRDYRFACIYYEKAATQGNATAQYYLGYCYYNGFGVEKNWLKAKAWYEQAAAQGQGDAIEALRNTRWA